MLHELATIVTPETLMAWHRKLMARKYDGSKGRGPGRPRVQDEIQRLVVRMSTENHDWGYRTGGHGSLPRRIIGFGLHAGKVDGIALCRMFNHALRGHCSIPKYVSSDHDPLYRFPQWQANLRILGVAEIKTVPYVPWSHPFVLLSRLERLSRTALASLAKQAESGRQT